MLDIIPYQSVGPIRFGMTASELIQVVGEPIRIRKNHLGQPDYKYLTFSVRLSVEDQTVVEVGLIPKAAVRLDDVDVFGSPTAFEDLIRKDGNPMESSGGFIVLLNLGITMTGFHDNDPSQKAVTAFVKGYWNDLRSELKEYTYSSPGD